MWFGLIPGPYRVVRAFTQPPRRTYHRSRSSGQTEWPWTGRETFWAVTATVTFIGLCMVLSDNPGTLPPTATPAPRGWLVDASGRLTPNVAMGAPLPPGTVSWISPTEIQQGWAVFIIGVALLAAAIASTIGLISTRGRSNGANHYPPPAGPPRPYLPQPAPLPDPDLVRTRSGHKPLNRELPMDRPHPWRTWEG